MSSLFGGDKPKAPEPYKPSKESIELEKNQLERQKQQESEIAEREARKRKGMAGSRMSLLSGSALGVPSGGQSDTLG